MSIDFANIFPDIEVFDILGDTISVKSPEIANAVIIQAAFSTEFEKEELAGRIDHWYQTIEIKAADKYLFMQGTTITYNGSTLVFHSIHPKDNNTYLVEVKDEQDSW